MLTVVVFVKVNTSQSLPFNPYKTFSETICVVLFSMLRDILQHQKGKRAYEISLHYKLHLCFNGHLYSWLIDWSTQNFSIQNCCSKPLFASERVLTDFHRICSFTCSGIGPLQSIFSCLYSICCVLLHWYFMACLWACLWNYTSDLCHIFVHVTYGRGQLGSRVVSVLDSGAEGPGFKSQLRCCRATVLDKLFTPIVPLFTKQRNW